jgi:LuxR family maltose regulon positive regulatory protein
VDYLISEVLEHQDETTRQFLLRTSVLDRFCAGLCDHVVFGEDGEGKSQAVLDLLEQENMFLVPLDNQRHWYRYHHLFSDMLFHSLQRSSPEQIPGLHRKASDWFESKGYIPEAVKHALAGRDWDSVAILLDKHALSMLFQGYGSLIIEWCHEIPRSFLEGAPNVCIYYAWALVLTFRDDFLEAVEEKLQIASRAIEKPGLPASAQVGQGRNWVPYKDWVIGQTCVIRSQILLGHFNVYIDPQELISLSLKGLKLLPDVERSFRATCRINLALAELMRNNPDGAQKAFEDGLPSMLEAGNFLSAVTDIFYQARLAFYTGQLDRAESLCQQWKARFAELSSSFAPGDRGALEVPAIRGLDIVQSFILLERGQLEDAERLLVQKLESLGWASWMELHGFIELARLYETQGKETRLKGITQRMSRLGPQHAACAEALEMLYAAKKGLDDPGVRMKAEAWTKKYSPNPNFPFSLGIGPYHCDTEYFCNVTWARVQIALGNSKEASTFIDPALQTAKECGLLFRVAELSILNALNCDRRGQSLAALSELGKALEIAEARGYSRFFDDGPQLDRLIQQAIERKIHPEFARQLLTSLPTVRGKRKTVEPRSSTEKVPASLVDPLSERELEVLRLLATGLPPAEVAKKLYLSPFTLKAHTQNIYTKLGVHSRIEAINKARKMDLL